MFLFVYSHHSNLDLADTQEHSEYQSNGIVKANVVVVKSTANCKSALALTYNPPMLSGTEFECTFLVNTTADAYSREFTSTVGSAFGVTIPTSCTSPSDVKNGSTTSVMFWDVFSSNSTAIAEATICEPQAYAYRAEVLYNSTNCALLGVSNVQGVTKADMAGYANVSLDEPWTVSNATLNGSSLNGCVKILSLAHSPYA